MSPPATVDEHSGVASRGQNINGEEGVLPLPLEDYKRYGRQMILDGFGLPGQLKLKDARVLVVGAGGLGCPAIQYLAAAGIGCIGVIDHDTVELSNLQRQILHTDATIGWAKAQSAKQAAIRINPRVEVTTYEISVDAKNALGIISNYDIVLDCTDNLPTRYLLSDVTASLRTPLVSGAALKFDGQLCVYNLGEEGPCYRCVFPKPPTREGTGTCEEVGVLGAVTGVIGTLQATEAVKILAGLHDPRPSLLIYSALANPPFRSIKLRSRRPDCLGCGKVPDNPALETDYVAFCGGEPVNWVLAGAENSTREARIRPKDLAKVMKERKGDIDIIDVRPTAEFSICRLPGSRHVLLPDLLRSPESYTSSDRDTYVVCRLGNDSQTAATALRAVLDGTSRVKDLVGGLRAWSLEVDSLFPVY